LDLLDPQVLVAPDLMVLPDLLALKAKLVYLELELPAYRDHKGFKEKLVHRDHKVIKVLLASE
jgi:hypothetical protein